MSNSGYYNKEVWPLHLMGEDHPLNGKFGELTREQLQIILDASLSAKPTFVKLDGFGEIVIDQDLQLAAQEFVNNNGLTGDERISLSVKTAGGLEPENSGSRTLRYPKDAGIKHSTDYVFFQFGKYIPPFKEDVNTLRGDWGNVENPTGLTEAILSNKTEGIQSNQVKEYLIKNSGGNVGQYKYNMSSKIQPIGTDIMLPMPQDLSNELQQSWQGKQFTATGRAAIAALGAGNFSHAKNVVENIAGTAKALQNALATSVLNSIPGVGGNLDANDVSGATRGIVINPNAELMYDSPQMREIGMIFKLVAQNQKEAKEIRKIITRFRQASLPTWGSGTERVDLFDGESTISGTNRNNWWSRGEKDDLKLNQQFDMGGADNWIQVPMLCQFTFMTGSEVNRKLIQFKPCAIQAVEVNYTPDGTYATYSDSSPVAIELRLNFMETKLLYSNEVGFDDEGGGLGY